MSGVGSVGLNSEYLTMDTTREPNQELGKDAFMQLLVTQLRYQDPLNPMDNQEMMAQMAQFSALEQMMNVSNGLNKQIAHNMMGNYVEYQYKDADTGQLQVLVGKIDYVKTSGDEVLLGIGQHEIEVGDVLRVVDASQIQSNTSAFDLIGQTIQGVIKSESKDPSKPGKVETIVEGKVLEVVMKEEEPYVVIGTGHEKVEVALSEVQNIIDKPSLTNKWITATIKDNEGNDRVVEGEVEYILMQKDLTYLYVNGQFIDFEDIETVKDHG